jgi:DUF971 family protein
MALRFIEGEADLGSHLTLRWDNGRRQRLSAAFLRSECPCENCKLAPIDLEPQMFPGLRIDEAVPVGRYALQLTFSDGHSHGAYSFDLLQRWPDEA